MSTWVLAPPPPPTAEVKSLSSYFFFPYTERIFSSPVSPREIMGNGRGEDALSFEARFPTQTNKKEIIPSTWPNFPHNLLAYIMLFPENMRNIKSAINVPHKKYYF